MGIIGRLSNWKKEKYEPWKEEKYNPWAEEKFRPWKKKMKQKCKNIAVNTGKNIGGAIHSFKEGYNETKGKSKNPRNNPSEFVWKIGYIEHLHIGNSLVYKSKSLPNTFSSRQTNELPYHQFSQFENNQINDVFTLYEHIRNQYYEGNIREVVSNCQILIESVMKKIASMYNFQYVDINQFLFNLSQISPSGKKLILYNDILEYKEVFNKISNQMNKFTPEIASTLFSIAERIVERLKNEWSENIYDNFIDENSRLTLNSWTIE